MSRRIRRLFATAAVGVAVVASWWLVQSLRAASKPEVPTTRVRRGDVDLKVYTIGDLRPLHSTMLVAPPVGGTLQIVRIWPGGTPIKAGETVVEFDPSEQQFKLEQSQFDLEEAEQKIIKSNAEAAVQAAQDKLALLKARFAVRSAELDVSRNELLSSIDAQKNALALEEARRRLLQLEHDVKSHEVSNSAELAVLRESRAKSQLEVNQARQAIASMQLKAPFDGTVAVQENRDALGGIYIGGVPLPEFREGDTVRAGRQVAEVLGDGMELQVKVNEADRANINPGQKLKVEVDGLPGVMLDGTVKTIASVASRAFFGDGNRGFDAAFTIDSNDPRLHPGESARVTIAANHVASGLLLPRQAIVEKDSKSFVYVAKGSAFTPREVRVTNRTEGQVVLEGIPEGTEVALGNPETAARAANSAAATPAALSGATR